MAAQIDNTSTPTQKGAWLPAPPAQIRHCESITLTTLADGHAMPSENAATPAASTKVRILMATLFAAFSAPINVTSPCCVARFERANWLLRGAGRARRVLIDTHDDKIPSQIPQNQRDRKTLIHTPVDIRERSFYLPTQPKFGIVRFMHRYASLDGWHRLVDLDAASTAELVQHSIRATRWRARSRNLIL
jgi:hypothetical protein